MFTQPWTIAYYAMARAPKDYVPLEYACFEGNEKNLQLMVETNRDSARVGLDPSCILESIEIDLADPTPAASAMANTSAYVH